jgi:hypothetical protein
MSEIEPGSSGAELIEQLQRTLGIAVIVESVESAGAAESDDGDPAAAGAVTIHATFMFGSNTTTVTVTDDSESQAWNALARAAIAWRNSDYQHIQMWPGAG